MRKIHAFSALFSAMLLLSACGSTSLKEGGTAENNKPSPDPHPTCCRNPDGPRNEHQGPADNVKRSIYFDFDQYVVKDEFRPLVEAHAKYLANHRDIKVYLIGNTDARGGREYNLALGQKRAESVHTVFSLYGVGANQLEAISFGEEQPKAEGDNEAAWAENRRVDIKYFGE
ncbi:MAG TPA: peptidoglycan-associated lipoprotein Pal [Noviherbaspirillum sp.]|nr:peptidoglycan-associated lipoprotein Pal [Noviherbaspirillum sp.]